MSNRLIPSLIDYDLNSLEEVLMLHARDIESAFISSEAGKDEYTRADLLKMAIPFALETLKSSKK
ncbi:Uncharacterized protein ChrSV_1546 [Chromobacterium vaccinii]|nr:Uncharacterized protein ChrSW_1546 [Chromobacterium vaccinii]QND89004.1 Uncharacterized protein ChrSV_1546 [Chromobacterium vaccinii]